MTRAHKAIGTLIMEGGLPKEAIDLLIKANHTIVSTHHGPVPGPEEATGEEKPVEGEEGAKPMGEESEPMIPKDSCSKQPPSKAAPPFPPRAKK